METLYDLSLGELEARIVAMGATAYRARQVREWAYRRFAAAYEEMTNVPAALRERLAVELPFPAMEVVTELASDDGLTRKRLIRLGDGKLTQTRLRQAMIMGSVMASFTVEKFSVERLASLDRKEIAERFHRFKTLTSFEDISGEIA